jgi:DNA polymerase III subunit gamma/tau
MDKFIVSARKYRPQTFDTVVGQGHITTTLKNAIKNQQLAHAFLFCGPRGVGKTTCARILAKTINCLNPAADGEACNVCSSCVSFNEGTSMNIHELDAASNNSVDDIRTLVEQVRFAPQAGKYKVYIIDEVHMLSSSAFNAFLKTLEEPPPYAIFILATTEKHKILPTILSRCQIFDFKRITLNDTVEHLEDICKKEDINAEKAALQVIAQKSEGCMRDALSIMDKIVSFSNGEVNYQSTLEHLNILDADYYFRLLQYMQQQDLSAALMLYDDINRKGFEGDQVLNGFAEFIRNLLVAKDEKALSLLEVVENFREKYLSAASVTDAGFLISALNVLNEAEINYRSARNKRLHVELVIIKLTYLQQALELSAEGEGLNKKKQLERVRPVTFKNIPIPATSKKVKEKKASTARLEIEVGPDDYAHINDEYAHINNEPPIITTTVAPAVSSTKTATAPSKESPRIGRLQNIRDRFANKVNGDEEKPIALTQEALQEQWDIYVDMLRAKKNPAVPSFLLAKFEVLDDSTFDVITNNNLEQKFIETEKRMLSEHLQKAFCNKQLFFAVRVTDNPQQEIIERPLSKRDQYQKMAEQYPLIKELRDRLKLDLDY